MKYLKEKNECLTLALANLEDERMRTCIEWGWDHWEVRLIENRMRKVNEELIPIRQQLRNQNH